MVTATPSPITDGEVDLTDTTDTVDVSFSSATDTSTQTFDTNSANVNQYGLIVGIIISLAAIVVLTVLLILVITCVLKKRCVKGVDSSNIIHSSALFTGMEYNKLYIG